MYICDQCILVIYFYPIYLYSQERLTSGRQPIVKIIAESLSQHDEKHVVLTPGKGRKKYICDHCIQIKCDQCIAVTIVYKM
jgi:hypothetical protein